MLDKLLNPIIKKSLGSVIRAVLMLAVPYMVSQGIWTTDQGTEMMTGIAAALAALVWSLYEKYHSQKKLVTALAAPAGTSQQAVEVLMAKPQAPPVSLPKDVAPRALFDKGHKP